MRIGVDFDGTLVSCRDKQIECFRDGLRGAAANVQWSTFWRRKRQGQNNGQALKGFDIAQPDLVHAHAYWKSEIETARYVAFDRILPGTLTVLSRLSGKHRLFLVSARQKEDLLLRQIEALGITRFFSEIEVVPPVRATDGKSDSFRRMKLDCYLGDTETDFAAAQAASIPSFIVQTGQRSAAFLRQNGIPEVFASLHHVVKVLDA